MRIIWTFARKELLLNIRSARFLVGLLLCLVIIPFTMMISVNDYKIQSQVCRAEMARAQARMDSCVVWSSVRPVVARPPEMLSLFSRGISNNVGSTIGIWLDTVPVLPDRITWALTSPFMKVFPTLDFSGVLGIMISLLALVFSYDTVTREREEGTLRFIFSSSGSRLAFLVGKWLGVILTVMPVIVSCFGIALGFVIWGTGIPLSPGEWAGVGWMWLASVVYLSLFAWMGIFISTLNSSSVNSVVSCMLCWLFFLFAIPSLVSYLSRNLSSLTAYERIDNQKKELASIFWKDISHVDDSIRNALGIERGVRYLFNKGGQDGEKDVRGGSRLILEHTRRLAVHDYELRIEHAERCWQLEADYLRELSLQRSWQDGLSLLSPSATFSRLLSGLCHTDAAAFEEFMDEVREFRRQFLSFLMEDGIVGSVAYVTPLPESDFMEHERWQEVEEMYTRMIKEDSSAFEALIKDTESKYGNRWYKPVDTSSVPSFVPHPVSGWERLGREWFPLLFLCLVSCGFMGGAIYGFTRYDLR